MSNYYEDYTKLTREEKLSLLMSLKDITPEEEIIIAKAIKKALLGDKSTFCEPHRGTFDH